MFKYNPPHAGPACMYDQDCSASFYFLCTKMKSFKKCLFPALRITKLHYKQTNTWV